MREVISLHLGQAGIQTGKPLWKLFCAEHGISPDGQIDEAVANDQDAFTNNHMFIETPTNTFKPRAIFADLEPTACNKLLDGSHRELYQNSSIVFGSDDADKNYARGHNSLGKKYVNAMLEHIRRLAEASDSFQSFMVFNAVGGGTGSGFGSLLLERLSTDYKKDTLVFPVYHTSKPGSARQTRICPRPRPPAAAWWVADPAG
jgi:tubulin alpha